jgi:hypothetical protein
MTESINPFSPEVSKRVTSDRYRNLRREIKIELKDPFGTVLHTTCFIEHGGGLASIMHALETTNIRVPFKVCKEDAAEFYFDIIVLSLD